MGHELFEKAFRRVSGFCRSCFHAITMCAFVSVCLHAQAVNAEDVKIGEETYPKEVLIEDFLNIAFSETLWNQETGEEFSEHLSQLINKFPDANDPETKREYEEAKRTFPWLADYIYHPDGWPRSGVINKWTHEITVAIGWPSYGEPYHYPVMSTDETIYPLIERQVRTSLSDIEKLTGLSIRFIAPDDPKEKTERYAQIRIVPIIHTNLLNFFKTLRWNERRDPGSYRTDIRRFEPRLWGAVPFSPFFRSQVDGYFLPNPDNSIGFSLCNISSNVQPVLMRALIAECLLRSLGLPDVSKVLDSALIGHWNKPYDKVSKLPSLDGRKESVWYDTGNSERDIKSGRKFIPDLNQKTHRLRSFTPYDKIMLSLLYCPMIEPGMDKYEVIRILSTQDGCWKFYPTQTEEK